MVAPAAGDLQIPRRISLSAKTEPLDEPNRGAVAGLDVGFDTMKTEPPKGVIDHQREALGHEPLSLRRRERVVAEVTAAEGAVHDLADVDDADERAGVA